jgi:hypothetical protein
MKRRVEKFIDKGIKYFINNANEFQIKNSSSYDKVYNGYLASLGPAIITSGVLSATTFYEADKKKRKIIKAIFEIIKDEIQTDENNLKNFLIKDNNYQKLEIRELIIDAVIGLKLAYRTFKLEENKNENR